MAEVVKADKLPKSLKGATLSLEGIPTSILQDSELKEMVDKFRLGDYSLKDKFIVYHIRIAISAVRKLSRDTQAMLSEMYSEAFVQLCKIPLEVHEGRLKDYGLTPYTVSRVRTVCRNFMRSDRVLKIPPTTGWRTGKRVNRVSSPNPHQGFVFAPDRDNFMYTYSCRNLALVYGIMDTNTYMTEQAKITYNEILACVRTEGERLVISYRSQDYTDKEIAHIMGCSTTTVLNSRKAVEKRYKEMKKNEDLRTSH